MQRELVNEEVLGHLFNINTSCFEISETLIARFYLQRFTAMYSFLFNRQKYL
jgi:hypothetical protein